MISIQILMQRYAQLKILGYIYILFILCIGPAGNQGWASGGVRSKRVSNWGTLGLRCRFFRDSASQEPISAQMTQKMGLNFYDVFLSSWIEVFLDKVDLQTSILLGQPCPIYLWSSIDHMWCLGCAEYWPLDRSGSWLFIQTQTRICTKSHNVFVEISF